MDIKTDISKSGVTQEEIAQEKQAVSAALDKLWSGKEDFTGWR